VINLFEYQNREKVNIELDILEEFLDLIWSKREKNSFYFEDDSERKEQQQFLNLLHKNNEIKSSKYVGVIHFEGHKINLLPKIFYDNSKVYHEQEITQIQNHILWWLSYCRKIKFPNYQSTLGNTKSDFFEVLVYLFSKYSKNLLGNSIYQQYEEINQELTFVKGRVNTSDYINQNLSTGRWHKISCTYDAFVFDNEFNRILKYVTSLLFNATRNQENKKNLRDILFILDEVSDVTATAEQCSKISFNPMFSDFETVRDYCYLFLNNCISFDYKNDLKLFAFLLPMEYVFEDFIFGFIEKEIESIQAKAQRRDTYLDESKFYNLKPDLFLQSSLKSIVADTKYKIIYSEESDPKKGISQNDLYQMLAYAVRFDVDEILIFYPNTLKKGDLSSSEISIRDKLAGEREIKINIYQLPVLNKLLLESEINPKLSLNELFEENRVLLKEKLLEIFSKYTL
jgi:5-methylcytosine-specific restriction enzyme subunit McrC